MKRFIVTGVGVLVTVSALVFSQAYGSEFCDGQREMAEQTMRYRQSGAPRAKFDAVVYSESGQAIADMAWARSTVPEKSKRNAISGFATHVRQLCEKASKSETSSVASN